MADVLYSPPPTAARNVSQLDVFRVLQALAEHADPDGSNAYPSLRTLAEILDINRRTVENALRCLAAQGRIVKTADAVPRKRGATYSVELVGGTRRGDSSGELVGGTCRGDSSGESPDRTGTRTGSESRPIHSVATAGADRRSPTFTSDALRDALEAQGINLPRPTLIGVARVLEEHDAVAHVQYVVEEIADEMAKGWTNPSDAVAWAVQNVLAIDARDYWDAVHDTSATLADVSPRDRVHPRRTTA
jgi:hypothetical protein